MSLLTKKQLRELLNASLALKENSAERTFWLGKLDEMTEDGLQKLAAILKSEATQKDAIDKDHLEKKIGNNNDYLAILKRAQNTLIPKIQEYGERSEENPDAILSTLNNA